MEQKKFIRICIGASCAGLGLTGYLGFIHLGLLRGELYGGLLCGDAGTLFNCHAVAASRFSRLLGIPLAFWGIVGYLAALALAVIAAGFRESAEEALTLLAALAAAFLVADVGLLAVMMTQIHFLCPLCLLTYAANLLLAISARRALRRPWPKVIRQIPAAYRKLSISACTPAALFFWGIVLTGAVGVAAVSAAASFMSRAAPGSTPGRMASHVRMTKPVQVNTDGDAILGSPDAPIQVIEFSDFLCPLCQEAAKFNTIILANHRNDVALRVKQFPLDQTCNAAVPRTLHPGACQLAVAAKCAQEQGRFWAFHDRVFRSGPAYRLENLEGDLTELGLDMGRYRECLAGGRGLEAVKRDIQVGSQIKIGATPSYMVNGIRIRGSLPPAVFEELLQALRDQADSTNNPNQKKGE